MSVLTKAKLRAKRERNGECLECGIPLTDLAATLRFEGSSVKVAWTPHNGRCGHCRERFYRVERPMGESADVR